MIILTLILMIISLIVFVLMNRQKDAFWLSGLFIGFILTNIGLMYYYSKMGGLTHNEQLLFFLTAKIQERIQFSMMTLDNIARILNLGKHMFVYFVLMFSLNLTGKLQDRTLPSFLLAIWPIGSIVLIDPLFYRTASDLIKLLSDQISFFCILIYSLVSTMLMFREYFNRNIGWMKKKLRYIMISVGNLMIYFLFFCQINATSIFYANNVQYYNWGFKIYQLRFSLITWVLVISLFIFFLITGLNSLLLYTKINIAENRDQISLERQLNTANMGTRVFIHGIKNQLLAESILINRLKQETQKSLSNTDTIGKYLNELELLNINMNARMEGLYKAFKQNSMILTPHHLTEIVDQAMKKLVKKIDNIQCFLDIQQDSLILADLNYLSEAVYNILSNAIDAIKSSPQADHGEITITLKKDGNWCVIRIADNGVGMEKVKLSRIFEPFYTDKNTNYSWGIGLSYVKQTVKYHFGKLHVESTLGVGSKFILAFPIYAPQKKSDRRKRHETT